MGKDAEARFRFIMERAAEADDAGRVTAGSPVSHAGSPRRPSSPLLVALSLAAVRFHERGDAPTFDEAIHLGGGGAGGAARAG